MFSKEEEASTTTTTTATKQNKNGANKTTVANSYTKCNETACNYKCIKRATGFFHFFSSFVSHFMDRGCLWCDGVRVCQITISHKLK